jgi:hypothetical protein
MAEDNSMKKLLTIILAVVLLTMSAIPSFAQGRSRRARTNPAQYSRTYDQSSYYDYGYRDRSFWDKHRDKVTVGAGAGAGALLGSIIGGKKGAIIGALTGAGGSALYTYKLRDRNPYYRR